MKEKQIRKSRSSAHRHLKTYEERQKNEAKIRTFRYETQKQFRFNVNQLLFKNNKKVGSS